VQPLLLLAAGALFAALFLLISLIRAIAGARKVSFLDTLLAFLTALLPLAALVTAAQALPLPEPGDTPAAPDVAASALPANLTLNDALANPLVGQALVATAVLGLAVIVGLFSLLIALIELRRPERLRQSRGVLGLGVAVLLAVMVFAVPVMATQLLTPPPTPVLVAEGGTPVTAPAPAGGAATAEANAANSTPSPQGESGEDQDLTPDPSPSVESGEDAAPTQAGGLLGLVGGLLSGETESASPTPTPSPQAESDEEAVPTQAGGLLGLVGGLLGGDAETRPAPELSPETEEGGNIQAATAVAAVPTGTPEAEETATPAATPTLTRTPRPTYTPTATLFVFPTLTPRGTQSATADSSNVGGGSCIGQADYNVRLRAEPNQDSETLATIPFGTAFTILGRNQAGTWWYAEHEDQEGWVNGEFVTALPGCDDVGVRE
jgi:hypothetical protein